MAQNAFGSGQVNGAMNRAPNPVSSDPAQDTVKLLQRLVDVLAPPKLWIAIPFNNLAVNAQVDPATIQLNNLPFNLIMATVVGNNAQINVYLNSADVNSQPPDFAFLSGYPTMQIFIPETQIGQPTIVSVGSNPASGKIYFGKY